VLGLGATTPEPTATAPATEPPVTESPAS
jgi:hypothetical protein